MLGNWREWDADVYRLAVSMEAAFSHVIGNPDADADLAAEIVHLRDSIGQYRQWHREIKHAG
jgi:hypothetical protein